jgi:hypothetical protein
MMMVHPSFQHDAQKEIDALVGRKQLPSWKDRPDLPLVEAIILESMRFVVARTVLKRGLIRRQVEYEYSIW